MSDLIFPYEVIDTEIDFAVRNAVLVKRSGKRVNQTEADDAINQESRIINLCHPKEEKWDYAELNVLTAGTRDELERYFQENGPLNCVATAVCKSAKLRKAVPLERSTTNKYAWEGIIRIYRAEVSGMARIGARISGSAGGRNHRYLTNTRDWVLYLDEAFMPQISGSLKVSWVNFATDLKYGNLKPYAKEPYYLNLESPIPEVYLNKDLTGLPEILSDEIKPGPRRAVRQTMEAGISKSAWLTLFQTSLASVQDPEEGEGPRMPDIQWQESVLRQLLPKIFPGSTADAALRSAVDERKSTGTDRIISMAAAVIGRDIAREGKAARTAISDLEIAYGGEE